MGTIVAVASEGGAVIAGDTRDVDDLVSAARDTVGLVMERDATTGGDIDVWSLSSDSSTRPDDH